MSMPNGNGSAEDHAIAAFVRKGATFSVDDKGNVTFIYFADATFTDSDLKLFAQFPKLVELNLSTCTVDDGIWTYVARMPKLESLTLWGSAITDDGMEHLGDLSSLKKLDVRATGITD